MSNLDVDMLAEMGRNIKIVIATNVAEIGPDTIGEPLDKRPGSHARS